MGRAKEVQLGSEYIVTVYDIRDGERVMIYPRPEPNA
jgi:hypothetical protein